MNLLIIDNDPESVELLALTVGMTWPDTRTLSASSGDAGIYIVESEGPNLVLLTVDLPDIDGFSVCREIRRFSDVPIIILTDRAKQADIVQGLYVGADDCISKPVDPMVFMARVRAVLKRSDPTPSFEDRVFEHGDLKVYFGEAKVTLAERDVTLSPTEYQLFCQLIKNVGKIVPRRTLLGLVWGREHQEDTSNLKAHIKHIRRKLGDDSTAPKFIFTKHGVGYGFVAGT